MRSRVTFHMLGSAAMLCAALPALAQTCQKQSPPYTVALLELYTSEGCSSCPPADRQVSALRTEAARLGVNTEHFVPLALHVDYWDTLGWKDRFASPTLTARQRWLSGLAAARTIYTPEVFVDGHELRGWHSDTLDAIRRANARPAEATVSIVLGQPSAAGIAVAVTANSAQAGQLFVVLYENGVVSNVTAGENSGVQLHHDYVVREWIGPTALNQGTATLNRTLRIPVGSQIKNLGVAAFVQSPHGQVLQALSLPACS